MPTPNTNAKMTGHDVWQTFLFRIVGRLKGAPTTVQVRDNHLEEHQMTLARDLPLEDIELELRPLELIRIRVVQASGALETIEIEYPKAITVLEEGGAANTPDAGLSFQIESAARLFFVHIGISAH